MWNASAIACASCLVWSVAGAAFAQDQIHWQPDLETAQRTAAQSKRLVLIHFWAPWCKPCRQLEQSVFSQPETGKALEQNFVMVKLNADDSPATTRMYYVSSLPTDVIITPDGRLVASLPSPPTSTQYIAQMNQAAEGHRRLAAGGPGAGVNPTPHGANPYMAQAAAATTASVPAASSTAAGVVGQQPAAAQAPLAAQPAAGTTPPLSANIIPAAQPDVPAYAAAAGQPQPPVVSPPGAGVQKAVAASMPPTNLPPGSPPLGLDGCCPVTLVEQRRWAKGDAQWGAIHRGRTYLFASSEAQHRFLANPDAYSPVAEGNDPVLALDNRQFVSGNRQLGVFFEKRVYLFSSEETLRRFEQNPKRYAAEIVQAMR
jgi:YHS domain-containing protein/thioredoxin-related protein